MIECIGFQHVFNHKFLIFKKCIFCFLESIKVEFRSYIDHFNLDSPNSVEPMALTKLHLFVRQIFFWYISWLIGHSNLINKSNLL